MKKMFGLFISFHDRDLPLQYRDRLSHSLFFEYICMCTYTYIYIETQRERERESERQAETEREGWLRISDPRHHETPKIFCDGELA